MKKTSFVDIFAILQLPLVLPLKIRGMGNVLSSTILHGPDRVVWASDFHTPKIRGPDPTAQTLDFEPPKMQGLDRIETRSGPGHTYHCE